MTRLLVALFLLLFVVRIALAGAVDPPSDKLFYDFPTAFGAVLGLTLH